MTVQFISTLPIIRQSQPMWWHSIIYTVVLLDFVYRILWVINLDYLLINYIKGVDLHNKPRHQKGTTGVRRANQLQRHAIRIDCHIEFDDGFVFDNVWYLICLQCFNHDFSLSYRNHFSLRPISSIANWFSVISPGKYFAIMVNTPTTARQHLMQISNQCFVTASRRISIRYCYYNIVASGTLNSC
jgi:hypothetical protein